MARHWRSTLSGPIIGDPMYDNEDYLATRRPVPRVRPEGAYIAEAHRGCLDILFKMQALTTGGGELDRPRYRKVKSKSSPGNEETADDGPPKPAYIGITRPAHSMPDGSTKFTPNVEHSHKTSNSSDSRSSTDDNNMNSINEDVRLIKSELESLKRRVHADSRLHEPPKQRPDTAYGHPRHPEPPKQRPDTAYGRPRHPEPPKQRPDTAYGRPRHPEPHKQQHGAGYGQSRSLEISRNRPEYYGNMNRPNTPYEQSRQQETARYRSNFAYRQPQQHEVAHYRPDIGYDDDEASVDEQWDNAPRDWVERTRRRREVEEEVTYRRANGHTETYHRQARTGRPMASDRPRVTFRGDQDENQRREEVQQRTYQDPPRPALKASTDDPDRPEGYRKVPDDERREMLALLMKAENEIRGRYTRLPVILDTKRSREHKRELEEALDELQSAIAVYAQKKVYIKNNDAKW